jgi:hypothetical protein
MILKQERGSCIGSPPSPPLCDIVVLYDEFTWTQMLGCHLQGEHYFVGRYVDNRAVVYDQGLSRDPRFAAFLSLAFYREPVTLEDVGNTVYLGYDIDVHGRTMQYVQTLTKWRIRSLNSANSIQVNLAGYRSRILSIRRNSFPSHLANNSISQLTDFYVQHGYDVKQLRRLASRTG